MRFDRVCAQSILKPKLCQQLLLSHTNWVGPIEIFGIVASFSVRMTFFVSSADFTIY